jgi:hypothetical protein
MAADNAAQLDEPGEGEETPMICAARPSNARPGEG